VVLQSQILDIQSELHLLTQNLAGGDCDLEERALWRAKQEAKIFQHQSTRPFTTANPWMQLAEARRIQQKSAVIMPWICHHLPIASKASIPACAVIGFAGVFSGRLCFLP
jgi:hypothetical protein